MTEPTEPAAEIPATDTIEGAVAVQNTEAAASSLPGEPVLEPESTPELLERKAKEDVEKAREVFHDILRGSLAELQKAEHFTEEELHRLSALVVQKFMDFI